MVSSWKFSQGPKLDLPSCLGIFRRIPLGFGRYESVQRKNELWIRAYFLIQGDPGDFLKDSGLDSVHLLEEPKLVIAAIRMEVPSWKFQNHPSPFRGNRKDCFNWHARSVLYIGSYRTPQTAPRPLMTCLDKNWEFFFCQIAQVSLDKIGNFWANATTRNRMKIRPKLFERLKAQLKKISDAIKAFKKQKLRWKLWWGITGWFDEFWFWKYYILPSTWSIKIGKNWWKCLDKNRHFGIRDFGVLQGS